MDDPIAVIRACAQAMRIFDRPETAAEVDRAADELERLRAAQPAVPDGWFIHAPDGKRVAISVTSMDKGYWESRGYTAQPFAMLAASQRKEVAE